MTEIKWPLGDKWERPDLDHGYIIHHTKTTAEVEAMPMAHKHPVINAAERYARHAGKVGIAVTADEWVLVGYDLAP